MQENVSNILCIVTHARVACVAIWMSTVYNTCMYSILSHWSHILNGLLGLYLTYDPSHRVLMHDTYVNDKMI